MTLTSDIIRCSYCDKSIEYRQSRISNSTGYLVCRACRVTPSVSEAPTDSTHYQEIFAEFEAAKLCGSPHASDYSYSSSEESLYERNVQEFDQLSNPLSIIERARKSAGLSAPTGFSPRKEVGLLALTPASSSIDLSTQHQPSSPMDSIPLDQVLAEFGLDEYHTSDAITLLPNALMNQDKHSMPRNRHMKPMLAANPRREPEQRIDCTYVNSRLQERKGKMFLCVVCHGHFNSFSALNEHKLSHRRINLKPSTSINSGASTSFHKPGGSQQSHESSDQAMSIKEKSSIRTKILASTKTPRSRGVLIFRGGRSIRVPKKHPANKFPCHYEWCEVTFCSIDQLWEHVDNTVHDLRSNKVKYICKNCNKSYAHRRSLINHQRIHTGINLYSCEVCGKVFTKSGELTRHARVHTSEKPFKCETCDLCFSQSGNLKIHKFVNTQHTPKDSQSVSNDERSYKCDVCSKIFSKSDFRIHELIYKGQCAYFCPVCSKRFPRPSELKRHERSHTGERPYKCKICLKLFGLKSQINQHIKRLHQ